MDDERLAGLLRGADVHAETVALPLHVGDAAAALAFFHLVIVEAGFADGHDTRACRQAHQVFHGGLGDVLVVGVHAHAGPEVVVAGGQGLYVVEFLELGADAQRPVDLGGGHGGADLGHLVREFGEGQVAVGVGEHRKG